MNTASPSLASGQVGSSLLEVSRDAFVQGMQVAAAISASLAIGLAIFAVLMLRNVRPGSGGDPISDQATGEAVMDEPARRPAIGAAVLRPEC
jgi:hypothetical protein